MGEFGHIDGVEIGQIFASREELSSAKVHTPAKVGIGCANKKGACSVVLSDGYEDNVDGLNWILYTGQGGRGGPNGKQVANQEFTKCNEGLQLSCHCGRHPVRVARGHQIANGPAARGGYRYDGLYYVKACAYIKGKSGFYIYRFLLVSKLSIDELESILRASLKPTYKRTERPEPTYSCKCQFCGKMASL